MARKPLLTAITALGLLAGLSLGLGRNHNAAAASPLTVEVYIATYCGQASIGWYVSKTLVDLLPKNEIVRVNEGTMWWWCATVNRSNVYSVSIEEVFPIEGAGVTVCASCSDH